MTRGALETPPRADASPGARARATAVAARLALLVATLGLATAPGDGRADDRKSPDGQTIREVRIVGNDTIPAETIRGKITSRANRPYDSNTVDRDIHRLTDGEKLFSDVTTSVTWAPDGQGVILTFRVVEMPVLTKVEYIGRRAISEKEIEKSTQLKKGARANSVRALMAKKQIEQLYFDKGYEKAEVHLLKGGDPADREVIFTIFEGPWSRVGRTDFVGNKFVSDAVLQTKLVSKKPLLGLLGGHYDRDGFEEDARKLTEYYQGNGYLLATIRPVVRAGDDIGTRNVTFVIDEGPRFRVRNVVFEGNRVMPTPALQDGLKLHSGEFFNDAIQTADREALKQKYTKRGHIDAQVLPEPKVTTEPGVIDLVYRIQEGDEYTTGMIIVAGNERTMDRVIRREADMAGLLPGERLDSSRLDKFKTRLMNTGYFQANPQLGKPVNVQIINRRPANQPFGENLPDRNAGGLARMQNPEDEPPPATPPLDEPPRMDAPTSTPGGGSAPLAPFGAGGSGRMFSPPVDTLPETPAVPVPAPAPGPPGFFGRRPLFGRPIEPGSQRPQTQGPGNTIVGPSGAVPGLPNNNLGPDRQEPFTADKAYADILANVDEAPTAKFSLGFGASSFGGLYGNVTFTENNFNIFAIPKSFEDIYQGRAFRGAGQQFSLELSPGTLINMYSVSFRDPYLFNLPVGLSTSGYQFSRFYYDWREQRSGGRFALGGQIGTQAYLDAAFRIEEVSISGFKYPAPAALLDVAGHTTLATFRPSFRVDTRDSPFLPSSGGFYEAAFEQGVGTYTFSKVTAEARQYFTVGSRPDGSGKRVLTLRSFFGATSRDTPIYERFFAGNLNSLRGFQFRGVGPYVLTVNTGGLFTSLASVEYRFPWTANDHIQQVFFADSGTVENDYRLSTYRVSVGTGFRILIPQVFKQVPLAFDLAFPLSKGPQDRTQAFNFSIGAVY